MQKVLVEKSKADAPSATGEVADDNDGSSKALHDDYSDDGDVMVVVMEKLREVRMRRPVRGKCLEDLADGRLRKPSASSMHHTTQALSTESLGLGWACRFLEPGLGPAKAVTRARLGCLGFRALSRTVHITISKGVFPC